MIYSAPRRDIDYEGHLYRDCRLVATLVIDGADCGQIEIWHWQDGNVDFFFVTERDVRTTFHTTIRKAFSQACKNGGWG